MASVISLSAMVVFGCSSESAKAEQTSQFTGEEFLTWDRVNQDSFIEVSVTMAGIVSGRARKDISRCIDEWYSLEDETRRMRNDFILKIISENPTYHPQGVILAVLEEQCGSLQN